jgi:hypothetical protein
MATVRTIAGEWAVEVAKRGVDPRELEARWEASEQLHGACDALTDAATRLRDNLCRGIEAWDASRDDVAAARARFEQALAEFRRQGVEAGTYSEAA